MSTLDNVFLLSLCSLACGGLALLLKACFRMKFSACETPCFTLRRDIQEEAALELAENDHRGEARRSSLTLGGVGRI